MAIFCSKNKHFSFSDHMLNLICEAFMKFLVSQFSWDMMET